VEQAWAQTNQQLLRHLRALGWTEAEMAPVQRAHALAAATSAGLHRSSGRPLLAHCVGVADVVAALGHGSTLVEAALLHPAVLRDSHGTLVGVQRRYNHRLLRRELAPATFAILARYSALSAVAIPAADETGWRDPDVAVLHLANIVEELDSSAEFIGADSRRELTGAAVDGAARARAADDPRLAALLEVSAARAAAVEPSARPAWLVGSPGPPLRVAVGWNQSSASWLMMIVPKPARALRRRLLRALRT
jgi:hypothetical protein